MYRKLSLLFASSVEPQNGAALACFTLTSYFCECFLSKVEKKAKIPVLVFPNTSMQTDVLARKMPTY